MTRITMTRQLRPLALSLALGLGAVTGLATAAYASTDGQTYNYATDVWPQIQAQQAEQAQLKEAQARSQPPVVYDGSSRAPQYATSNATATNELGQRVDHAGIPLLQDRGADN